MTSLTEVFVTVKPDMDKFGPEVKSKLSKIDASNEGKKVAGRFGVGFNGAFGGIVKHSAGLFVGAFAVIKSAQVFGGFINDARESAKVARVSAAVVKSTGGAAKITAAQMGDLATAISNKTGADDEAIQSGENLLATFTNVRNSIGKGNDIFNRASQAATDMASAMNNGVVDANGLKAANIQLGKALNDPVKGVTALSKVGVSFTAQQKEQIAALVKSGDTLGAQKIILGEVGKEFGGAAAAAADPLSRLQTIAGNLAEKVGGFLLPKVDKFATFVGDKAVPVISGLADKIAAYLGPKLTALGGIIRDDVLPPLLSLGGFIRDQVLPRLQDFAGFFVNTIIPKMKQFAGFVLDNVVPAVQNLIAAFTPFAKEVGHGAVDVFQKLSPVVVSVGTAIVSNVLPAIKDFTKFLSDNKTLVGAVATGIGVMVAAFYAYRLALTIVSLASKAFAAVQGIVNAVLDANPIGIVVLALAGLAAGLIYAYKHSDKFRQIVDAAFKVVRATAVFMWDNYLKPMFAAFVLVLKQVWEQAQTFARIVGAAWGAIKEPARVAIKYVIDSFLNMVDLVLKGAAKAFGWVPNLGDKLKSAAKAFGTFRDDVNKKLDGLKDHQINFAIKYSSTGVNLTTPSSVGRRAAGGPGGPVHGPGTTTSDTAGLFRLSRKEWVIKAASSMKYGDRAMAAVNAGTATIIPGLAGGGRADPMLAAFRALGYKKTEADWDANSLEYQEILRDLTHRRGHPRGLGLLQRALRLHGYSKTESDWDLGSLEMNEVLRDFIERRRYGDPMIWAAKRLGYRTRPGMSVHSPEFGKILTAMLARQGAPRGIMELRSALRAHGYTVPGDTYLGSDYMRDMLRNFLAFIPGFAGGGRPGLSLTDQFASAGSVAQSAQGVISKSARAALVSLAKSGGNLASTIAFGRAQVGKPYVWGAGGPNAYDCSGLVGAMVNHMMGRNPFRRIGATGSMPWSMFAPGAGRAMVGWFKGNPGHTAMTIDGENFESAGGVGVRHGAAARGANNALFTNRMRIKGFARGGRPEREGIDGDLPFDLPNIRNLRGRDLLKEVGVYDRGGAWPSGTLGVNTSGKTETVIPGNGEVELGPATLDALERSQEKAMIRALQNGTLRMVSAGNGAYVLQMSNG